MSGRLEGNPADVAGRYTDRSADTPAGDTTNEFIVP
jgi:hypothetical protein